MYPKIKLTPHVLLAIGELHRRAYNKDPSAEQVSAYTSMVCQSLMTFVAHFADVPFFTASPVHSFDAISISGGGDRFPRHVLRLAYLQRGHDDYLVATSAEIPLGQSYDEVRLMEEARHMERGMPDLPASHNGNGQH